MANLYELTGEYARLMTALELVESDDDADKIYDELGAIEDDIAEKAQNYAKVIKNLEADANAYKLEKQRLAAKQTACEHAANGLKKRLRDSMSTLNIKSIQTGIGKWWLQENPPGCDILDADKVPAEYHVPQPDKIDSAGILKWFRETGEELPGVKIRREIGIRFK